MPRARRLVTSLVPRSLKAAVARQMSPKVGFVSDAGKRKDLDRAALARRYGVAEVAFAEDPAPADPDGPARLIAFSRTARGFPEADRRDADRITSLQALRLGREITPFGWKTPMAPAPVDLDCAYNFKVYYPGLNLLYNEIPKNASSAIKAILLSIEQEGRVNRHFARWFTHHRRWQAAYPDLSVDWTDFEWRGAFRFAFQRNPFDRVLSAYKNAGWADHYGHMEFSAFLAQLPDLLQAPLGDMVAIHLKPMSCFVPKVEGKYYLDFVGKVENFDADIRTVLDAAGITNVPALPVVNASQHKPYRDYYDAAGRAIVARLYEEDLAFGAYSF